MITKVSEISQRIFSADKGEDVEGIKVMIENREKCNVLDIVKIEYGSTMVMMTGSRKLYQIPSGPLGKERLGPEEDHFMVQILKDVTSKYAKDIEKHAKELAEKAQMRESELKMADAKNKMAAADALKEQLRKAEVAAKEAAIEAGIEEAVEEAEDE